MAHRCWAINKIVRAIVAILVRDRKKASAVALASCSKSLEEPALGEIWLRVSSLMTLVKCFPPDVWEFRDEERTPASTTTSSEDVRLIHNRFSFSKEPRPKQNGFDFKSGMRQRFDT